MKYFFAASILIALSLFSCTKEVPKPEKYVGNLTITGQGILDTLNAPYELEGTITFKSEYFDQIVDLKQVSHIKKITKDLRLMNNLELSDLSAFNSLEEIGSAIMMKNNPKVTSLEFLKTVKGFRGLGLSELGLTDLDDLKGIKKIQGWLGLTEMHSLKVFTDLEVELVKGLMLDSLVHMTNTNFLGNLKTIVGTVIIKRNPELTEVSLPIKHEALSGNIIISSNEKLTKISGFENVKYIGKVVEISDNSLITNLDFLKGAIQLNGNLTIKGNSKLTDFSALANIQSVKGEIKIENNGELDSKTKAQLTEWKKKWKTKIPIK